jgi:hypothetical protein
MSSFVICTLQQILIGYTRNAHRILLEEPEGKRPLSSLAGVMVSVLATGPKGCGFESGQGDGFLRVIKIRSIPSSRMGSKAGMSHVVSFYGM